ncbi:MAG TPA: hypothetical protein VMU54_22945 [Planctomycetota bacterium]|nr:hypothetical protein [Planctomycetota bacterium]
MSRTRLGKATLWVILLMPVFAILSPRGASAQGISDLLGGKNQGGTQTSGDSLDLRFGRDRVDLGLSPNLRSTLSPEKKYVGLSAQADLRMICGQYDLKSSFQHLLGREAREEFLEGILATLVQELIGSGMELLCQAEPTLCTLLQNHSISANLKVGYYKDLCQAVESAVVDGAKKSYANQVDQCMKDKKDQGLSIDQAVEACQKKSPQLTGFRGDVVGEIDLGKEFQDLLGTLGLRPGAQKLAQSLSDQTKLGTNSVASQVDGTAVPRLFDEAQADYAQKLQDYLAQIASRQPVATIDLRALVPAGAPPVADDELREVALLSPREQAPVVASLSSAWALFEMGDNIRELERALEALKAAPTLDEQKRKLLEDRLARLRNEKARLAERFRDQEIVMQAMAQAKVLAGQEASRRVGSIQSRAGETGRNRDLGNDSRSYGTLPSATAGQSVQGAGATGSSSAWGCTNCGFDFSFGSYNIGK